MSEIKSNEEIAEMIFVFLILMQGLFSKDWMI